MKEMTKKTAVVAMAGIMAAGMLTGCGEKKLDGSKTVATVDGTEIPLGVVSLSVRDGQMQTEAMYRSYMGGSDFDIWDTEAEKGKTYGEQLVEQALEDVELMYIMKEKAADYDVELTDDDEKAIEEAAASFMEANSDEAIADLAVTEDQVKTFLELETYKQRIHDPIIADVDKDVSDEEAQQSSFSYVSISTADLSDDEIKQKKEDAQKIQDELTKDPEGDFDEIAKSVDDSYSSLEGTFDANDTSDDEDSEDEDSEEDSSTSSSTYPDEVIKVLRTLDDGEVAPDVIETDTAYYVVKLNQKNDEEATETKKESIISTREQDLYYHQKSDSVLDDCLQKVIDLHASSDSLFSAANINLALMNIMLHILDKKQPDHHFVDPNIQNSYVAYTLDHIHKNYMYKIHQEDIAKELQISVRYLSTLFKKYMNITLSNYINIYRINKSIELMQSDKSLTEIAQLVGFKDSQHYSKLFMTIIGETPSSYRKSYIKDYY